MTRPAVLATAALVIAVFGTCDFAKLAIRFYGSRFMENFLESLKSNSAKVEKRFKAET